MKFEVWRLKIEEWRLNGNGEWRMRIRELRFKQRERKRDIFEKGGKWYLHKRHRKNTSVCESNSEENYRGREGEKENGGWIKKQKIWGWWMKLKSMERK